MSQRPVTLTDIVAGHVSLDIEGFDRIYLNGYVPALQTGGQVAGFLHWRGFPIASPAALGKISQGFRAAVGRYAEMNQIPWVIFRKGDRKLDVMRPYLEAAEKAGRSEVVAIGEAREFQWVFDATRKEGPDGVPWFRFYRTERLVTCYYFYIHDRRAGPAFIKVCAYAPYPVKIWLNGQYAEQPAMPHEAEARPVTVGSRMLETAYLCRLRRHDLVACPSLWVSVSHIDGTGEIMTSEVRRIGGLRPPAEVTGPLAEHAAAFKQMLIGQGYARGTISAHLGLMSGVSRWLDVQGLPARALADLAEVDRF